MTGEAEQIEIDIGVPGAEEASLRMFALADAMRRADANTKALQGATAAHSMSLQRLTLATTAANTNAQAFNQTTQNSSKAITVLSGSLARVLPEFGKFHGAIGQGANAIGSFVAMIGGPGGALVGGAIAAVTLLGVVWNAEAEKAKRFEDATKRATAAIDAQIAAAAKRQTMSESMAGVSARGASASQWSAMSLGVGSRQQYAAADAMFAENIRRSESQAGLESGRGNAREVERLRVEQQILRDKREFFSQQAALAAREESEGGAAAGSRGAAAAGSRGATSFDREAANQSKIAALDAYKDQVAAKDRQRESAANIAAQIAADERSLIDMESFGERQRLDEEEFARKVRMLDDENEKRRIVAQSAVAFGGIVASSGIKALSELAKGHKASAGAFIEGIGDQLVASGTAHVLQAAAIAWIPGMQGNAGGLAAAGAVEIGAGVAFGAAGARMSGGSSAGGAGRGGSSGGDGGRDVGPASPVRGRYGDDRGGGGDIIYITMPTVLRPTAEDGRAVEAALAAKHRVYGAGA